MILNENMINYLVFVQYMSGVLVKHPTQSKPSDTSYNPIALKIISSSSLNKIFSLALGLGSFNRFNYQKICPEVISLEPKR
jgi:hypothetical protein